MCGFLLTPKSIIGVLEQADPGSLGNPRRDFPAYGLPPARLLGTNPAEGDAPIKRIAHTVWPSNWHPVPKRGMSAE